MWHQWQSNCRCVHQNEQSHSLVSHVVSVEWESLKRELKQNETFRFICWAVVAGIECKFKFKSKSLVAKLHGCKFYPSRRHLKPEDGTSATAEYVTRRPSSGKLFRRNPLPLHSTRSWCSTGIGVKQPFTLNIVDSEVFVEILSSSTAHRNNSF